MTAPKPPLADVLRLGLIQTTVDPISAWSGGPPMSQIEEEWAISEIRGMLSALGDEPRPHIAVLPELAVPRGFEKTLRKTAEKLEMIIIAGLDYEILPGVPQRVRNEAVVVVPKRWMKKTLGPRTTVRRVRKTYPAHAEERDLADEGFEFEAEPAVWIFDSERVGRFGVAICYDFLDLERAAMYRSRLQHLIVLAFNKDATSFNHVAEAAARMVFANVIVCNCGYYGGSLAISPKRRPEERTIFRHGGAGLATVQTFELPVREFFAHQKDPTPASRKVFKNEPPGFNASNAGEHYVVNAPIESETEPAG